MTNHLRLDFDLVEFLARVDTDDGADHLRNDDHVPKVGFHSVGLLVGLGLLFGLAELLDETHGLALQATVEAAAGTGVNNITELLGGEVEEPVKGIQLDCDLFSEHFSIRNFSAVMRLTQKEPVEAFVQLT